MKKHIIALICILLALNITKLKAQRVLTIQEVLDKAIKTSPYLRYYYLNLEKEQFVNVSKLNLPDPLVSVKIFNKHMSALSIRQDINISDLYSNINRDHLNNEIEESKSKYLIALQSFKKDILELYLKIQYLSELSKLLKQEDIMLSEVNFKYAKAKNNLGAIDKILIDNILKEVSTSFLSSEIDLLSNIKTLKGISNVAQDDIEIKDLHKLDFPNMYLNTDITNNSLELAQYNRRLYELKAEKIKLIPNIFVKWNGAINNVPANLLIRYFEVGLSVPVYFGKYNAAIEKAKWNIQVAKEKLDVLRHEKWKYLQLALADINSLEVKLNEFDNTLLPNANKMLNEANRLNGFNNTNLLTIVNIIDKAFDIRIKYITELYNFNKAIIAANFINNSL